MTERELGNFSKWPLEELRGKERSFPIGHRIGDEIRAEITRRQIEIDQHRAGWDHRCTLITVIIAIASVVGSIVYGLDRGIYVGSTSTVAGNFLYKKCRYLFVTGITELPAHGGLGAQIPVAQLVPGFQSASEPDRLYCRFFGE